MDTHELAAPDRSVLVVERADRCTLFGTDGRAYLDGAASLGCNVHGHRHPELDAAIRRQLSNVADPQGFSHPRATELAERLTRLAPAGLRHIAFSESAVTAREIAMETTLRGQEHRTRVVRLSPGDELALDDTVAAVLVEPLVDVAAGIQVHPPGWLRMVRSLTRERGIALIADETATAFGRTGTMFACEQEGVEPDVLCVANGLTGGYLPLAATLSAAPIREPGGNALACAAALASLDVFEREHTLARLQPKIALLGELLATRVEPLAAVREVRQCGLMAGIETRRGAEVVLAARERGVIVHALGDVVVLMPPLAISEAELRRLVAVTAEATSAVQEPARAAA
jgi:adenosylmethionine-8-amino-7-oxononanoate aminotransferase